MKGCSTRLSITKPISIGHSMTEIEPGTALKLAVATFLVTFVHDVGLHLQFTALDDLDVLERPVIAALRNILDLVDYIVALENLSKNDVLAIEPTR
jgi:hypothetical protein